MLNATLRPRPWSPFLQFSSSANEPPPRGFLRPPNGHSSLVMGTQMLGQRISPRIRPIEPPLPVKSATPRERDGDISRSSWCRQSFFFTVIVPYLSDTNSHILAYIHIFTHGSESQTDPIESRNRPGGMCPEWCANGGSPGPGDVYRSSEGRTCWPPLGSLLPGYRYYIGTLADGLNHASETPT